MTETASVTFTVEELWLLQGCIRHEIAQMENWHNPPASMSLNDAVAEAILMCEELGEREAAILLDRGDCLAIDATVPQGARGLDGTPLGKRILLKSFEARRTLGERFSAMAKEPDVSAQELKARLSEWEAKHARD